MIMRWRKAFASLECELLNRRSFKSKVEARLAVFTWIEAWYTTST